MKLFILFFKSEMIYSRPNFKDVGPRQEQIGFGLKATDREMKIIVGFGN